MTPLPGFTDIRSKSILHFLLRIQSHTMTMFLNCFLSALRRQQDGGLFKPSPYAGYPFLMIPDLANLSNLGNPYLTNGALSPGARTVSHQSHAFKNAHVHSQTSVCVYNVTPLPPFFGVRIPDF